MKKNYPGAKQPEALELLLGDQKPKATKKNFFSRGEPQPEEQERILAQMYEKVAKSDVMPLLKKYKTTRLGLPEAKHKQILTEKGYNIVSHKKRFEAIIHFIKTCLTVFNVLLVTLAGIMYGTGDMIGGSIIISMIVLSVVTGFIQERRSNNAVEKLQKMVSAKSRVYRLIPKESYDNYDPHGTKIIAETELLNFVDGSYHLSLTETNLPQVQNLQEVLRDLQWYENHYSDHGLVSKQGSLWVETTIPSSELVEGDIILLCAGDLTPSDCRLLTSKDLYVSQATLTGESLPVEKSATHVKANKGSHENEKKTTLFDEPNICLMGTTIISGTATALVLRTGRSTYFGSIARTVEGVNKQTSFDRGINRFIIMMVCFMVVMCVTTLLINGLLKDNWVDAVQFSLAVAVGLTPEMLPMIITVTLAKGALVMSKSKVIVKRLKAIQNFGAMNILCTDKTGTLTQDEVVLEHYLDALGQESLKVLEYSYYNSFHQTGLRNLLDKAIIKRAEPFNFPAKHKVDEIPFDFERRRMSVIVADDQDEQNPKAKHLLICKGAIEEVLSISEHVLIKKDQEDLIFDPEQADRIRRKSVENIIAEAHSVEVCHNHNYAIGDGDETSPEEKLEIHVDNSHIPKRSSIISIADGDSNVPRIRKPLTEAAKQKLIKIVHQLNEAGLRVICVATKKFEGGQREYSVKDEKDLTVVGFIAFLDPPKPTTSQALVSLKKAGIAVKVLTGDNDVVAKAVCRQVGINVDNILTGIALNGLDDAALLKAVETTNVFCKLTPSQKKRIVNVLQNGGNVVGFMGDGINDSPAIRAADVGISVDNAVDIAKESADIILLEKSLLVLGQGVKEGRTTFGNIIKYIKMGASSNFGNVFSVTGASLLLPFIPMQAVQILTQNLLYDFSQTGIPFDHVDPEYSEKPRKWEIGDIARFMVFLGPISSIFDYCTFALMWYFFKANSIDNQVLFQTGWFVEGLISQTLIVHIIRTRKIPFIQSWAARPLTICTMLSIFAAVGLVYSPIADYIPFQTLPGIYFPFLVAILLGYVILAQLAKALYYRVYGVM